GGVGELLQAGRAQHAGEALDRVHAAEDEVEILLRQRLGAGAHQHVLARGDVLLHLRCGLAQHGAVELDHEAPRLASSASQASSTSTAWPPAGGAPSSTWLSCAANAARSAATNAGPSSSARPRLLGPCGLCAKVPAMVWSSPHRPGDPGARYAETTTMRASLTSITLVASARSAVGSSPSASSTRKSGPCWRTASSSSAGGTAASSCGGA